MKTKKVTTRTKFGRVEDIGAGRKRGENTTENTRKRAPTTSLGEKWKIQTATRMVARSRVPLEEEVQRGIEGVRKVERGEVLVEKEEEKKMIIEDQKRVEDRTRDKARPGLQEIFARRLLTEVKVMI